MAILPSSPAPLRCVLTRESSVSILQETTEWEAGRKSNFPADARNILTVGSVNEMGENAAFSAVGPTADGRIKPDVMAYGSPTCVITGRGNIINDNGTSFSSPLIAGMVACLWQALPQKTAKQIMKLVRLAGNNQQHPDNVFGYGVPDFWKAYQTGKAIK